jgi:hypothetical protein
LSLVRPWSGMARQHFDPPASRRALLPWIRVRSLRG